MKFPFFASFIVFCLWLGYEIHKHRNMEQKAMDEFWETEVRANKTRRKSLDGLNYITIPFDALPMHVLTENERIMECHETLNELSKQPIVNLTGITNTELKLAYGAPNIKLLSEYDQRYTTLARTLQTFAELLYENGHFTEACTVLEFAVSTHTDISASYRLLITIYEKLERSDKISALLPVAENLRSGMKDSIVAMIQSALTS